MKILLADDSVTIRRIEINALKLAGYEDIVDVDGGDRVLEELERCDDFGLVLLDWNMPVMNGLDCLKAIRANERTKRIPVIMVTAEVMKERVVEAIRAGASNYLVKPFEPCRLKEIIAETLGKTST